MLLLLVNSSRGARKKRAAQNRLSFILTVVFKDVLFILRKQERQRLTSASHLEVILKPCGWIGCMFEHNWEFKNTI